ncbi:MAG TPA: hypothetical protein DEH78_08350, partial [Solibacterales bacterium]|nr:hypothetical protein [Bryobacterales bacterium]
MLDFVRDLRLAGRNLRRRPGFALLAVLTLGAGIALNVTVASVLDAYLLRSLPYPEAQRLHDVRFGPPGQAPPPGLDKLDWTKMSPVFEHAIAWDLDVFYMTSAPRAESVPGAWVTPGFMAGLGVQPALGRGFAAAEFTPGSPNVAMISHALWQRRWGGDPAILGKTFTAYVSDRPEEAELFTVVGVLPESFWHFNRYTNVFAPLRAPSYPYMARLRPGVSAAQAISAVNGFVRAAMPNLPSDWTSRVYSTHGEYASRIRPILLVAAGAGAIVLLIACANVAFLLIVRAAARQREVSIRLALGASRGRIAQMLCAEALVLGGLATSFALLLVSWTLDALAPVVQQQLGRPAPGGLAAIGFGPASMVAAAASLLLTLAFGLLPVFTCWRREADHDSRSGNRSTTPGAAAARLRRALIAFEVAGSITLLAGAGLMVRTTRNLLSADLGIDAGNVLTDMIGLRERAYPDDAAKAAFAARLQSRIEAIPGVRSAALAAGWSFQPPPQLSVKDTGGVFEAGVLRVSANYFATLAQPLVAGRMFTEADRAGAERVAVVSESLARRMAGDPRAALGRPLVLERPPSSPALANVDFGPRTIVGVVGDVRQGARDEQLLDFYVPLAQAPARFLAIYAKANGAPAGWAAPLAAALSSVDPEVPLGEPGPLQSLIDAEFARPRFLSSLLGGLALFAAALAVLGAYGMVAFA